jgi:predicted ATPase
MLSSLTFAKDFRCFKASERIDFHAGVNLLVGDQGAGKSSLLSILRGFGGDAMALGPMSVAEARQTVKVAATGERFKSFGFDFEKENPRTLPGIAEKGAGGMFFQVGSFFRSHGETVKSIIASLEQEAVKGPYLILFDEPDAGLSPRSAVELLRVLRVVTEHGGQVIASVHSPILMLGVPEVLSLEHRRWMPGREFLATHGVSGF